MQRPGKTFLGALESPGIFCKPESGNPESSLTTYLSRTQKSHYVVDSNSDLDWMYPAASLSIVESLNLVDQLGPVVYIHA